MSKKTSKKKGAKCATMFRQGDVCIQAVPRVPQGAQRLTHDGHITVAHGEATGHHHTINVGEDPADWWKAGSGVSEEQYDPYLET